MCLQIPSSAPAKAASDLHIEKSDGYLFLSAVTLSADVTSSLENLSCGFSDMEGGWGGNECSRAAILCVLAMLPL